MTAAIDGPLASPPQLQAARDAGPRARPRRAPAVLIGAACAVALLSIAVGFCTDDYAFRAAVRGGARSGVDLFRFAGGGSGEDAALVATGWLPWWSAPDLRLHFLRPLTGALFALDIAVFGDHALGYHLHSILWYLALLVAASRLLLGALPGRAGTLAVAVFALRCAHVVPYAWIAARHALVGAAPAIAALAVHAAGARNRDDENAGAPRALRTAGAALLLAVGLAGSEVALAAVPLWIAHDAARAALAHDRRWARAVRASAPALAIAAAYLVAYRVLGFGARGGGGYHDPFTAPLAFARVAVTRVPALVGDGLAAIPIGLAHDGAGAAIAGAVAAIAVAAAALALRPFTRDEARALAWLAPGALAATPLGASGLADARVLVVPDVGYAAIVGVLLNRAVERARAGDGTARRWLAGAAAVALGVGHLVVAPITGLLELRGLARIARATERIASSAEIGERSAARVFVVAASDPFVYLYPRGILDDRAPGRIGCWSIVSAAAAPHRLTRTGDRTFSLEPRGAPLLAGFASLFRAPDRPFAAGDTVLQCGATFHVDAVENGAPTRVSVDLGPRRGDGDDVALVAWRDHRLRRLELPAIGASIDVPWSPGPSRRFGAR